MDCSNNACTNKATDWQVCAQCFKRFYCSESCLESDWYSRHEQECEGHQFLLSDFTPCSSSALGAGAYSQVKLYKHTKSNTLFAIKSIKKSLLSIFLPLKSLFREIALHKSLNHDNIIKLYDQLEDSTKIYLILEYASSINLNDHIRKKKFLSEPQAAKILVELCLALRYLHEKSIIHRDIKPENILITVDGHVKLCDLGWSAYCDGPRKTFCGTLDYMAPEVFLGNEYGFMADVWSVGIVLFETLNGKSPFVVCTEEEKIEKIKRREFEIEAKISKPCKDLIEKILCFRPERRIGLDGILKHRWVQENFFFPNEIEAGRKIFHKDFGVGLVSFIKGMMCSVDFEGFSLDFAIPDLVKQCKIQRENREGVTDSFKSDIGGVISFISSSAESSNEKSWKFDETSNGALLESTTATGDPFVLDISEVPECPFTIAEKQSELIQLQAKLEQPYKRKNNKLRKSLIDHIFS